MPYITGVTYTLTLTSGLTKKYTFSPKHRGTISNDDISKWIISNNEEAICFLQSANDDYIDGDRGWGFSKDNGIFKIIGGINIDLILHQLKIAKFTEDHNGVWHGYPCNLKRKSDKPSKSILVKWVNNNIISKKEMSKISAYQKCNL